MAINKAVKIKVNKHVIDVWELPCVNAGGAIESDRAEYGESINADFNYAQTVRRRRETVRDLGIANFDTNDKFVTLTFAENMTDLKKGNNLFKCFVKRLKYWAEKKGVNLKYLAVIEFQKRGAIHYHMLCNLPFIKKAELTEIWGNGFVKINAIDKVDNLGAYITKYMTKEKADDRLKTEKGYLCSRNLKRPKVYKSWESVPYNGKQLKVGEISLLNKRQEDYLDALNLVKTLEEQNKKVYERAFSTDHGIIVHRQYNAIRSSEQKEISPELLKYYDTTEYLLDTYFGRGNYNVFDD